MDKITLENIYKLKAGDIIAKYPTNGDIIDSNTFKEVDINQSEVTLVVIQNIANDMYKLGYNMHGFEETYTAEINKSKQDLVNGLWWLNINNTIFSL
jgi:hypothetical protein